MSSSLRAAAPDAAPRREGRYRLDGELARGGMGVVYRAFDLLAAREVAYKRLLVPENRGRERFVALFQREYNTLVQLAHPSIVEGYEYGFDEQGPFYTMELLAGQGLVELAPLPVNELCRVIRDVASALALLHTRRLLHRDLSPTNVRINSDGRTKLIDFGALVRFGPAPDVVGTPAFMAPEAFDGKELDQRADLYALGALAYWGLTRKTAVRARTLDDLPGAWFVPIVPPSQHVPEIPKPLEELVLSLLSHDPLARPASAAEVMERLTSIADLEPEPREAQVSASYLAHPPLVGRDQPLALVDFALRASAGGRGLSLLVEAESGQGRSALLDSVTVRAQLEGATVLRADAAADTTPFGLARSLVRVAMALYPDLLGGAGGGRDSYFRQVLEPRRVQRVEAAWSPVNASERQARTLAMMQEMLLRASAKNPTVIVVDELHQADSESQALIATLAHEAHQHQLLLVLSARADAASTDAFAKIRACSRLIGLEPLNVAQMAELTDAIFGGASNSQRLAHWLHEQSGGNPARCMDLTRLLLQRGLIRYTAGTFTLPHDVGDDVAWEDSGAALLGRLSDRSALARQAAGVLSLQEMPMQVDHLAHALGAETREVVLALEELTARGLVSVIEGRVSLLSTALRAALQTSLEETARRDLHRRAARAILAEKQLDGSLRMQAGMHLLKAGEESEAVELLTARGDGDFLKGNTPIPLLEAVLDVLRRQGRTDEQCLGVLVPLVRGGFFGDLHAQRRHLDRTLTALANVCGVTTMNELLPRLGPKLALAAGIAAGLYRHARTPKHMRYGAFPETMGALLSILSASTAAYACAFESKQAFDIVQRFEALRAFGPDSAPYWSIEFCLATAEVGAAKYAAARARYERLLERFNRPVKGMNDEIHLQFKQGILHGLAQSKVADADPDCLRLAEELEKAHMFFAPHAQTVRMAFYGMRGQMELCDQHRRRGEVLALRGGISWSSVTLMTGRTAYMAMNTGDPVTLVRITSELERLSQIAPKTLLYRDAVRAYLELLRGRPERAVAAYEKLFASPDAAHTMAHWIDRTMYAKALSALNRHAEAKQVCEDLLAKLSPTEILYVRKAPLQQLALAEAALGDVEGAAHRLDDLIKQLGPYENPLWSGAAHRDRAKVALFANDLAAFDHHAQAMTEYFHATKNPSLIQQCELLQAAAQAQTRSGANPRALDDAAIAFETAQARLCTLDDMDTFETEAGDSLPPAAGEAG
jgi:tetratricopeptide (TPR) repeat protein